MRTSTTPLPYEAFVQTLRVLVVEDDPGALQQYTHFLAPNVGSVITANNGEEGIETFRAHPCDLIVSDIQMPRKSGLEMLREIRASHPEVPVILITAFSEMEFLQEAIALGVQQYVLKPVNPAELLKRFTELLHGLHGKYIAKLSEEITFHEALLESKTTILRDIAHHWRNPLNSIAILLQNNSFLLEETLQDPSLLAEHAPQIQKDHNKTLSALLSLSGIINDFASLFASDSETPQSIDVCRLLDESSSWCQREGMVALEVSCDGVPPLLGKPGQLRLCLRQLLCNAIDSTLAACPENPPPIELAAHSTEGMLTITCTDAGGGIPESLFMNLAEPYVSTKGIASGIGMGLFLVKQILRYEFGGTLSWENRYPGARFTLSIPLTS